MTVLLLHFRVGVVLGFIILVHLKYFFILLIFGKVILSNIWILKLFNNEHYDLEDLEVAFPALFSELVEKDSVKSMRQLVLMLLHVWMAHFRLEVAFERLFGILIRNVNINLVYIVFVNR